VLNDLYEFLNIKGFAYQVMKKPEDFNWMSPGENQDNWIRAVLLSEKVSDNKEMTSDKVFIAVVPANRMLDLNQLSRITDTDIELLKGETADKLMPNVVSGIRLALPEFVKMDAIIDSSIFKMGALCFEAGDGKHYIEMESLDYIKIHQDFKCEDISYPISDLYLPEITPQKAQLNFSTMRIEGRISEIENLPTMPGIGLKILSLKSNRHACATDLAEIVLQDPSLAAQVVSWAKSAYYGYRGEVDSVETAISRVLGFDRVMNLALGIALGSTMKVPHEGPLGLKNYWRQALLTANLAEKLCMKMDIQSRPTQGLVYLSGLLHNIGHLLLGHSFQPQFFVVNRFIEANPHVAVSEIEKYVLGITHEQMGAKLLKQWNLPEEVIEATRWHHQEEYASQYAAYSNLILLATHLLGNQFIGDSRPGPFPVAVLELLGIQKHDVETVWYSMVEHIAELDYMASQLAA